MAEQKNPAARKAAATGAASGHTKISSATVATAAKKPAVKKTAATAEPKKPRAVTVKKTAAPAGKKSPVKKATAAKAVGKAQLAPEEHYRMVQTAAYFIAERNGFQGYPSDYWLQAELEIAEQLRK